MLRSLAVRAARRGSALAVQQQRCYADAAVATQATVWDELGDLVTSDEGRRELSNLRSKYTEVAQKLAAQAKPMDPIDWAHWNKEVDPRLVQQFKQTYDTMKFPKYDGKDVEDATAQFAVLMKEAEGVVAASQTRIAELKAEIANIQREKERINTTTIDDELAADPAMAREVDEEVQKNYFMVSN